MYTLSIAVGFNKRESCTQPLVMLLIVAVTQETIKKAFSRPFQLMSYSQDSCFGPKLVLFLDLLIGDVVKLPLFNQLIWSLDTLKCVMQEAKYLLLECACVILHLHHRHIFLVCICFSSDLQAHHPKRDQGPSVQAPVSQVH